MSELSDSEDLRASSLPAPLVAEVIDICRRLKVSIQIVGPGRGLASESSARWSPPGARTVAEIERSALEAAIAQTTETLKQQVVAADGIRVVCSPILGPSEQAIGVILLAARDPEDVESFGDRQPLPTIASWFAAALTSAPHGSEASLEMHHLSSLLQILDEAMGTASEQQIVRAFVEAMAVWTDVEASAYVGDLTGRFDLQVVLPGSDRSGLPPQLDPNLLPVGAGVRSLSSAETQTAGFRGALPTVVLHLRPKGAADWVIVVRGVASPDAERRLVVHGNILAHALTSITAIDSSRLTWAMFQHLWPAIKDGSVQLAAEKALGELSLVLNASTCLAVARGEGPLLLAVGQGSRDLLSAAWPGNRSQLLVVPVAVAPGYRAAIGVSSPAGRSLTGRDETLAESVRSMLGVWIDAVGDHLVPAEERRPEEELRPVAARPAAQRISPPPRQVSAGTGDEGSIIVVSVAADVSWSGRTHACIREIRRQLRPGDLTGRLASGSIGILLRDAKVSGAEAVARRLERLVESGHRHSLLSGASVRLAARTENWQFPEAALPRDGRAMVDQ
jgi:hypothetical protein